MSNILVSTHEYYTSIRPTALRALRSFQKDVTEQLKKIGWETIEFTTKDIQKQFVVRSWRNNNPAVSLDEEQTSKVIEDCIEDTLNSYNRCQKEGDAW